MKDTRIPLLLLEEVLLPGCRQYLKVTTRLATRTIVAGVANNKTIAAQWTYPSELHPRGSTREGSVGVYARILAVQRIARGRYRVVIRGESRVLVTSLQPNPEDTYVMAEVEPYEDMKEPMQLLAACAGEVRDLYTRYFDLVTHRIGKKLSQRYELPDDPLQISFKVAHLLGLDDEARQRFLDSRSPSLRLREAATILRQAIEVAEDARETAHKAGGNGSGSHRGH